MTAVAVSWYLSVVFLLGAILVGSMAVPLAAEPEIAAVSGTSGMLSVLFAALAQYLAKKYPKPHEEGSQPPRWLLRLLQGLAILATLLLWLVLGG